MIDVFDATCGAYVFCRTSGRWAVYWGGMQERKARCKVWTARDEQACVFADPDGGEVVRCRVTHVFSVLCGLLIVSKWVAGGLFTGAGAKL